MANRSPLQPRTTDLPSALRWSALFALLVGGLLPASAGIEAFPYWDLAPTREWVPPTGIRPVWTLLLALLSVAGAGLAIAAEGSAGRRVGFWMPVLAGVGSLGVLAHGLFDDALHGTITNGIYEGAKDGVEHLVRGAPWIAMVWSAVGVSLLCRDRRVRTVVLAVLAGFAVPLLAKGLLQVYVEHPATVADFVRNKDAIPLETGRAPGSPGALAYERRLMQPEAGGWFGLSNVYATFMGAIAAGLLAAITAVWCASRRWTGTMLIGFGIAACALAGLLLSKSKGGIGAMGLSLALCTAFAIARSRYPSKSARLTRFIGPAALLLVLGTIGVRGLIGPDMGERSLLFRAFYAVGSLRIWGDHPFFGVGPDGFQDAYAAAKIPIATETVQSPHSVLFDWTATLGVFGLAWAALLIWQSTKMFIPDEPEAEAATLPPDEKPRGLDRDTVRFVVLVIAAVGLAATGFERALATPSFALARVVGLGAWLAAAIGLVTVFRDRTASRWIGFASGLAIIAHVQIEVTPVWVNAGPLLGVWLGAVTAEANTDRGSEPRRSLIVRVVPFAAVVVGLASIGLALPPTVRWQAALGRAAETVRPAAELRTQLARATATRDRAGVLALMESIRGSVPAGWEREPERAIEHVRLVSIMAALDDLELAVAARPGHVGTRKAVGRIDLQRIAKDAGPDNPALERLSAAAIEAVSSRPRSVGLLDWSASSEESVARLLRSNGHATLAQRWFRLAVMSWGFVDELSPSATRPAVHLMDLSLELASMEYPEKWKSEAIRWAREALRRDDLAALDPIAGLSDAERARVERIAGGSEVGQNSPED